MSTEDKPRLQASRSVQLAASAILDRALLTGVGFARWGFERRELTRWQRVRTMLRRIVGLPPLERDEEFFVKVSPIPSGDVLRFRRPAAPFFDQDTRS